MTRVATTMAAALCVACGTGEPEHTGNPATEETPSPTLMATVDGLSGPEAVKYDPDQDVWFVSNFGAAATDQRDGNGFISRVSADGAVEALRFVEGTQAQPLHMPRGMALQGDTLWVADVDGVHGFHRIEGRTLAFVDFRSHEPGFLNDIALDADGTLHVTDTGRSRVYSIDGRSAVVAVEDERTGPPNGITWDAGRGAFLLAPWGGGQTVRAWTPGGGFADVATIPGGNFDGMEVTAGGILVASQTDSTLWVVRDGEPEAVTGLDGAPADIGVDRVRGRVAIPYIARNVVEIWEVPSIGDGREP